MNARGAVEIIVATVGFSMGLLNLQMYSIIVLMAVVTSMMAGPLMQWAVSHSHPEAGGS
jgi:Kef-type K+ transport system membrane component KefB